MNILNKSFSRLFVIGFLSLNLISISSLNGQSNIEPTKYVDLATGNFNYSLPIFDVPGPEGGFPIVLNYRAGIKVDQEASWVGLGWDLNIGSINRSLNGYPDDFVGANVNITTDGNTGNLKSEIQELGIPDILSWYEGVQNGDISGGLQQRYNRYYDKTDKTSNIYGALYASKVLNPGIDIFDAYSIRLDDQNEDNCPATPAFDSYNILGPFNSGIIKPFYFENIDLPLQNNIVSIGGQYTNATYGNTNHKSTSPAQFKFDKEFSNSYKIQDYESSYTPTSIQNYADKFNTLPIVNPSGFNSTNKVLAGSKQIYWFTNQQIQNGYAHNNFNFLSFESNYTQRDLIKYTYDVSNQIGGFIIIDENGNKFHYSLPSYSYNEKSKYTTSNANLVEIVNQPYANNWLLTAITGKDYVDNGPLGLSDDDTGYWIKFGYGLWTDNYKHRIPKDFNSILKDITTSTSGFYKGGINEVYYLNYIRTRTHTAIFEKNLRNDSKGVADIDNGGYQADFFTPLFSNVDVNRLPTSSLKLERIFLFKNTNLSKITNNLSVNSICSKNLEAFSDIYSTRRSYFENKQFSNNVIDKYDLSSYLNIETFADKIALFTFESSGASGNELCKNTSGSFSDTEFRDWSPKFSFNPGVLLGKLTLSKISIKGKGGNGIVPNYGLSYSSNNPNYTSEKYDLFGMYKSDYDPTKLTGNEKIDRAVTSVSALNKDSWSLREILLPSSSKINLTYESDDFSFEGQSPRIIQCSSIAKSTVAGSINIFFDKIKFDVSKYVVGDIITFGNAFCDGVIFINQCEYNGTNQNLLLYPFNTDDAAYFSNHSTYPNYANATIAFNKYTIEAIDATNNSVQVKSNYIPNILSRLSFSTQALSYTSLGLNCEQSYNSAIGVGAILAFGNTKLLFGGLYITEGSDDTSIKLGGDIRVSKLSSSYNGNIKEFAFNYNINSSLSSGYVKISPYTSSNIVFDNFPTGYTDVLNTYLKTQISRGLNSSIDNLKKSYYTTVNNIIGDVNIYYSKVVITSKFYNGSSYASFPGNIEYNFSKYNSLTMNPQKPSFLAASRIRYNIGTTDFVYFYRYQNFISQVNRLESILKYDNSGKLLSKKEFIYLDSEPSIVAQTDFISNLSSRYFDQGRFDQLFFLKRDLNDVNAKILATFKSEEYPNVLTNIKTTDYKRGTANITSFLAFDFYSGFNTKTSTIDSYGKTIIEESFPAYLNYPALGLNINTSSNLHILAPICSTHVYTTDNATTPVKGLLSSSAVTWSNTIPVVGIGSQSSIWRPNGYYFWKGNDKTASDINPDGSYKFSSYSPFSFTSGATQASGWLKSENIDAVDAFSKPRKTTNSNGSSFAILNDKSSEYSIAKSNNASLDEIAYSGAEFLDIQGNLVGNVDVKDGIANSSYAHTGNYGLQIAKGKEGYNFKIDKSKITLNKSMHASVWVYLPNTTPLTEIELYARQNNADIISSNATNGFSANGWYQLNIDFSATSNSYDLIIGCRHKGTVNESIFLDDFRVHPSNADFVSNVYDQSTGELTYQLDQNNFYTRFEYDSEGIQVRSFREILNRPVESKQTEVQYNFKH